MSRLISVTFLLFSVINCSLLVCQPARSDNSGGDKSSGAQAIPSVSYCALVKAPKLHVGKLVRVKATWQFGFETTSLRDPECPAQPQAWLEFADEKELCPGTQEKMTSPGKSDKEAEVTVVGRLHGPGRYGHLGAYQFKFVVVCMERIKVTASDMK